MKRFTLTLVAVMITALSFAQRTVQPSKASLSALKSEMAIPQFKMERPTGKIAEAKVSAKAPAMAPTIISDTPAGTLKTYTRSGSNYDYNSTTGAFELSEQSGTIKIVFSTDGRRRRYCGVPAGRGGRPAVSERCRKQHPRSCAHFDTERLRQGICAGIWIF